MLDICAEHADDRQAIFQQDSKGRWKAFFIDHGHLFGGPRGDMQSSPQVSLSLDPRIYPDMASEETPDAPPLDQILNVDRLWSKIQTIPQDWKTKSALDSFARCLCTLSNPSMLQDIFAAMVDGLKNRRKCEHRVAGIDRKPVLRSCSVRGQLTPQAIHLK